MLKEYFEKNEEALLKGIDKSEFPHTAKILYSYYNKSKAIESAIKKIDFQTNFYPCIILLRSLIEHFIVATYIWIQFRINKNDDISKIYHEDYLIYEVIKRLNYAKSNNISISSRFSIAFRKILDVLTDKKILKQKDIEKLNVKANQFDIRKISKFLDKNLPLEYDNIIKPERIKNFLEFYNYFSSFVHGGPTADAMNLDEYKEDFISNATDFVSWSSNIVGFHRIFIMYFLSMNDEKIKSDFMKEMEDLVKTGV